MIRRLTFLTAALFASIGILSNQAVAQQNDASKDPTVVLMQTGTVTACNALFYDTGGPTGDYSANEDLYLVFEPGTPGARIKVTFLEFETENNYDKLKVYNGTSPVDPLLAELTGPNLPTEPFFGDNPSGKLMFHFKSDGSVVKAGWKATVECYTPVPNNLVAVRLNTSPTATAGTPKTVPFVIFNQGTADVLGSAYTVELQDASNTVLATANGVDIVSGAQASIDLIWTPAAEGTMDVKGVINFAADEAPGDNATGLVTFTIHPAGTYVTIIGPGVTVSGTRIPLDFYYKNSYAQTIYTNEQIGIGGGLINKIVYKNNFVSTDVGSKGIKVWMGETTLTTLTDGFIDPAELTLVFDGEVEFPGGINDININLQTPYVYSGGNLVIYTYRNLDSQYYKATDLFYLTKTNENRSRRAQSDSQLDPLAPTGGSTTTYIPDITMYFNTAGLGTISGNVTSEGNPVGGVTVKIVDATRKTTTDASGNYSLPYLIPGTYALEFSKFGFISSTVENINVVADQTATANATIAPRPQVTVSGQVTKSDTGAPVDSVVVRFSGYADYTDTTDANGNYSIANVWGGGEEYEVTIDAIEGYQAYVGTITVGATNITDHNIVMEEIAFPVGKVTAAVEGANVKVNWLAPGQGGDPKWITWSGEADTDNGVGAGTSTITCAHRFSAENLETLEVVGMSVSKVRFSPHGAGTYKVQVWTGGSATAPGTLAHEQVVPNVVLSQWNEVELTTPVLIPDGQELWYGVEITPAAANYPGGVDEGPAVTGFGDQCLIAGGAWATLTSYGLSYNWALGAYIDNGKGYVTELSKLVAEQEMNPTKVELLDISNLSSELRFTSAKEAGETTVVENSAERVFTNYKVYRLVKDQPQAEWTVLAASTTDTTYTDTGWEALPAAQYQYAVAAMYTNNVESSPRLSNILAKDMETEYTVNVKDNADGAVEGVTVTLTNHDGIEEHVYEGTTGATGDITFPTVWKGFYAITATKGGYEPFAADSIAINENTTFQATIVEIIETPNNLEYAFDGNDVVFTWNNVYGVNVTLQADDVWGDGSGYQLLLDADAVEYGQTIPTSGWLADCNAPATLYDVFEYKIPENADPVCNTQNMICNSSATILVPVGTYDYCIVNPTPNDRLWIAAGENGRKDDYVFEEGKNYHFYVQFGGQNDQTTITVTDAKTRRVLDVIRPGVTADENARTGEFTSDQISVVSIPEIGDYFGTPSQTRSFNGFTVYLDDEEIETGIMEETYTFQNVPTGLHTAGVQAVYSTGSSEIVEIEFNKPEPTYNVTFTVVRKSNGAPIVQANVVIGSESALTNTAGVATFELPGGEYTWLVTKPGFGDETNTVMIDDHTEILVEMVGMADDITAQGFMLYPNPATSTLTITRNNTNNATVEIYSNDGSIINSFEMNETVKEISVSELNSGVYFIRVIDDNATKVQRFIKQ